LKLFILIVILLSMTFFLELMQEHFVRENRWRLLQNVYRHLYPVKLWTKPNHNRLGLSEVCMNQVNKNSMNCERQKTNIDYWLLKQFGEILVWKGTILSNKTHLPRIQQPVLYAWAHPKTILHTANIRKLFWSFY
jgi:hypothetical protein